VGSIDYDHRVMCRKAGSVPILIFGSRSGSAYIMWFLPDVPPWAKSSASFRSRSDDKPGWTSDWLLVKSGKGWRFSVPYWFLMLLFLFPWLAFLFWRVRRQRKQTETTASAFS
jgi:hypothetical protein